MSLTHRTQRPRGAVRLTELTGKRFGTTLAALTLTLALAPTVSPTALADDVTQNDIDQSKTTESSTSTSIADLEAQLSQLNVDLESARRTAQTADEDYLVAANDLKNATSDAETAQQAVTDAAADVATARQDLSGVVAQTYEEGNTGPLDALTPFLTSQSVGDLSDATVAMEYIGADVDFRMQTVETCLAAASTAQTQADQKVTDKQTAATQAEEARSTAETAATNAQTAVTNARTQRSNLITQLAEQRNTTYELEVKHQDQVETDRKAREEAAAREAVGAAPAPSSAPQDPASAVPTASASPTAEPTPTAAPSAEPTRPATPTAEPPTAQPTPTAEPTRSATPEPAPSATPTAEPTAQPSQSATPEPTRSATPTPEPSATPTAEPTQTPTPEPEPAPVEEEPAPEPEPEPAPVEEEPAPEPEPEPEPAPAEEEPAPSHGAGAEAAISAAQSYLGVPYVWAGESYDGVDCSGLTMLAYQAAGIELTHSSRVQYGEGEQVDLDDAQPGDLIFWSSDGTQEGIYHVAIYLGDDEMIEAPTFGVPVQITSVRYSDIMPYAVRP